MSTLAAARADNFYYPKNWDPSKGSLNKFHKSHPLGSRAKKIKEGILTIRFEVPFHVRCTKCQNMIGKGVRFNAEKKAVGKFHSTKIWEFQMNCHLCGNKIIVRTDPENTDYKFVEGANKILSTENATDVEFIRDAEEVRKIREDPFARLENEVKDQAKGEEEKPRIQEIIEIQEKWKDDYDINFNLRKKFRQEKKKLEKSVMARSVEKNFALPLAEPQKSDRIVAKSKQFKNLDSFRKNRLEKKREY
jgi:coiled-coil domain-containing protein 130